MAKVQKGTIPKVWRYIRRYRLLLILSMLFAAATVAMTLYLTILIGNAIDLIVSPGHVDFPGIRSLLIKIGIIAGCTGLTQWLMNMLNNRITYHVIRDVRQEAFGKLQILPLSYLDAHPSGSIVSRIIADVDQFADGLLMGFTQLFTGVVTILGTLLFMLSISWKVTLAVGLLTPLSLFNARIIARRAYSMFRQQSQVRGELTALIDEMIGNQKVVQAFSHQAESMEQFDEINDRLARCSLQATFFSSITNPATRFVNALVYAAVGVVGALVAIGGGITVGELSVLLNYANQYTKPFNDISGVMTELQNALACAQRVFDFIDEAPILPDAPDAVTLTHGAGSVELGHEKFS